MSVAPSKFPGERLGLPETGIGSIARVGRRILALLVDWLSAVVVIMLVTGRDYLTVASHPLGQIAILGAFVVLQILGMWTMTGSLGHRLLGMHLVSINRPRAWIWRPLLRSVLLALVLPAIIWDSDQRGFHDKITGTALVRSR